MMAKKKGTFEKLIEAIQDNFIKIIAAAIVLGALSYFGLRNNNSTSPAQPSTVTAPGGRPGATKQ